jgi:hypothetical protein
MNDRPRSPRERLLRDAFVLQLKLVADGLRDALLIPVSLVAAIVGLLRGGADCDLEFRRVLDLGRRSERWINLFGHQEPLVADSPVGSIDRILDQVEAVVVEQRRKGHGPAEIRDAIRAALKRDLQDANRRPDGDAGESAGEPPAKPPQ